MSDIAVAALLAATILIASTISVEIGLSVALIELLAGVIVGNAFDLDVPAWLTFIGSFAGIVLTFQAGAEVDVPQFGASGGLALDRARQLLRAVRRRRVCSRTSRSAGTTGRPRSAASRSRPPASPWSMRCWSRPA